MTKNINCEFTAPTALPLFTRTYSRYKKDGTKESPKEAKDRAINGLKKFGLLTEDELNLIEKYFYANQVFVSGRWFWVGGTEWVEQPKNYIGAYNCASVPVTDWEAFRFNFRALLMGCGVGTVVELDKISQLPEIKYPIELVVTGSLGTRYEQKEVERTQCYFLPNYSENILEVECIVGDSKEGWVDIATDLLVFSSDRIQISDTDFDYKSIKVHLDLSYVRPAGIPLKGFGGTSNPDLLEKGLTDVIDILNNAVGRKLSSLEVCKILNIHGAVTVAGSIRRSALIHQGDCYDEEFVTSKDNLWIQDSEGNWKIDPKRDMLRYANHTLTYHVKPTLEDTIEAVRKQYYSGEGAIQYVPEAVARCNADLLNTPEKKQAFIDFYIQSIRKGADYLLELAPNMDSKEVEHRIRRYGFNPSLRGDVKLLTTDGYKTLEELEGISFNIINLDGDISESKVWQTGVKETIELSLSNRAKIHCTPDHIFMVEDGGLPAEWLKGKQLTPYLKAPNPLSIYTILGFIQGDGMLSRLGADSVNVCIGKKDGDILELLDAVGVEYRYTPRVSTVYKLNRYLYSLDFDLNTLITRVLPKTYNTWTKEDKAAFLNGLYSANGTVIKGGRVAFKTVCKELADQLLTTLKDDFGINGYITTNKPTSVEFSNGTYLCKMSYDVNIHNYESRCLFFNEIGFSIKYKTKKLADYLLNDAPTVRGVKPSGVSKVYDFTEPLTNWGVINGFITHNCGEICGDSFHCNLSEVHLNTLDPKNYWEQHQAFKAATLTTLPLLSHEFDIESFQYSREIDPIIGVSFTGLFDFFVHAFGTDWLEWWKTGRSREYEKAQYFLDSEREYLEIWKNAVKTTVEEYCKRHNIRQPNRYTTTQPAGSKSLLTGASPGWHPPKDTRYIRRITYSKDSPVVQACIDYGYKVIPSQSCKDEYGNLLDDINDSRVNEVLVEIPIEVSWADIADKANFKPKDISALAQLDFYMQVQKHYVGHNTSGTLELSEHEIEPLGHAIYELIQNDKGYISVALLAKFDSLETFPRLPFEPISYEKYLAELEGIKERRISDDFMALVNKYTTSDSDEQGPSGCDSDKCLLPEKR